jgi:hypothetical protein
MKGCDITLEINIGLAIVIAALLVIFGFAISLFHAYKIMGGVFAKRLTEAITEKHKYKRLYEGAIKKEEWLRKQNAV